MSRIIYKLLALLALSTATASALEYVPEVYKDDYVTVRSGVMESGSQPIHLGDRLTLAIEIDFDSAEVQVENLTEDIFRRNWGGEKGLVLVGPPEVSLAGYAGRVTTLRALFPFEVLDCPGSLVSCPGHKVYPLPVISLGYQIVDGAGQVVNNKSIRFNSWPGSLAVTQVLPVNHEGAGEFSEYFPDGAWSGSLEFTDPYNSGLLTALIGGLLLLTSFVPTLFASSSPRRVETARKSGRHWENLLALAEDETRAFTDEEWADLIRRCAVSFCTEEHGFNPYNWLDSTDAAQPQSLQRFRSYFLELLDQEAIDKERRAGYVSRLRQLGGLSGNAGQQGVAA